MISLRKSEERGWADHGWLKSAHTFSFANYHDPEQMGWGPLRVINQDQIEGGSGFGTHPHRDMEIISYVLEGSLIHRDSMDNHTVIKPGEVQVMSAGTGVRHSEFNGSPDKVARFLQIWIEPSQRGLSPSYGQKDFAPQAHEPLILVASSDGRAGSLPIRQSAQIWLARAARPGAMALPIAPDRKGWLQLIEGRMNCGQHQLGPGDALRIRDEASPKVEILETSHFLLFDLPS